MAEISNRKLIHISASQRAAKAARTKDFTVVHGGKRITPAQAFSRGAFVLASWWDEKRTLVCMKNGVLLMLMGNVAVEVIARPKVVEAVCKPHFQARWWCVPNRAA